MKSNELLLLALQIILAKLQIAGTDVAMHRPEYHGTEDVAECKFSIKAADGTKIRTYNFKINLVSEE